MIFFCPFFIFVSFNWFPDFYCAFFLSSCSTSSVLVSIQKPADISLPQDIKTVVVANRSIPTKKNLAGNILEGLVSGEGIGTDKMGSKYCVEGLVSILDNSDRFETKNIGDLELKMKKKELLILMN